MKLFLSLGDILNLKNMKKPTDQKLSALLDDLAEFDSVKHKIVSELRRMVFKTNDSITERMMYGGFMFSLEKDFGGIFISKNHVSFEFSNGYLFTDENQKLEGSGKKRRHLKFKTLSELKEKDIENFIGQAIRLSNTVIKSS